MSTATIRIAIELRDDFGNVLDPRKGFKVGNRIPLPPEHLPELTRNEIEKALVCLLAHAYGQIEKLVPDTDKKEQA
jgi:hypothetical protein